MKQNAYRQNIMKKKLNERRNHGTKVLVWTLNASTKAIIEDLGYDVQPYLYKVTTRRFANIKGIKNPFLKDLHYSCQRGKKFVVSSLKHADRKVLDDYGIRYEPIKFKIYLQTKKSGKFQAFLF